MSARGKRIQRRAEDPSAEPWGVSSAGGRRTLSGAETTGEAALGDVGEGDSRGESVCRVSGRRLQLCGITLTTAFPENGH